MGGPRERPAELAVRERTVPRRNVRAKEAIDMAQLIHESPTAVLDEEGRTYLVRVWGAERSDGTWEAWLEFDPKDGGPDLLRTERETSQPNRAAVDYWAHGLEPIYLDGAFARARGRLP